MKQQTKRFAVSLLLLGLGLAPQAFAADKPAAVVNGHAITQQDVTNFLNSAGMPHATGAARNQALNELVSRQLVYQDALAKGLNQRPDVINELKQLRVKVLVSAAIREALDHDPVTDSELKAEYKKVFPRVRQTEYKARHILVKSKKEAESIIAKLERGEKFSALAKKYSIGPTGKKGGELGWFGDKRMVPSFVAAVKKLKNGQFTHEPVKTQFGWHVIEREASRIGPTYDQLKPQLERLLQQQHVASYVEKLRSKAKIKVNDSGDNSNQ